MLDDISTLWFLSFIDYKSGRQGFCFLCAIMVAKSSCVMAQQVKIAADRTYNEQTELRHPTNSEVTSAGVRTTK